ncbi:hypothetical protein [Flavitalea sp.]|nr:hypothetical protein [Flavitalea sp.]
MGRLKYSELLALFLVFVFCSACKAQNKTDLPTNTIKTETKDVIISHGLTSMAAARANFSGKWKLNESKSEPGQFGTGDKVCLDWLAASKTMKIAGQADFLTLDLAISLEGALVTRQEKLNFDGKENEDTFFGGTKKSTVKWSDDGQTMTVNSVITIRGTEIKVQEVWKLINDGKSISLQANSNSIFGENNMKLVYDKDN